MPSTVVRKFYLLQATRSVGFVSPIFTLFLLRDLSFTVVGSLSALSAAVVVLGEVPTGYVGDRLGRRTSIGLSIGLKAISLLGFVFVRSAVGYAVLYVPWALGLTFASGSVDAWLYDTLSERLDAGEFTRIRGRGEAVMAWSSVVTAVGGGLLYGLDPTWPFLASAALNLLGLGALASLPRNRAYREDGDGGRAAAETFAVLRRAVGRPSLRAFALYVGLFFAVLSASQTYVQPIAESLLETAVPGSLPVGLSLGLLYASFSGITAVASQRAGWLEELLGTRRLLIAVPALTCGLLVLPRLALIAALPMFVAQRASRALLLPVVNGRVSEAVDDAGRATAVSAVSMLTRLYKLPLAVGAGVLADALGETTAVAALGAVFLLVAAASAVLRPLRLLMEDAEVEREPAP
jgi:MFS family permease